MARKFLIAIFIFLVSSIITIFIANLNFFYSRVSDFPKVAIYILKAFFFFTALLLVSRKQKQNLLYFFSVFAISIITIDSTVFFGGQALIPLRFPFQTLFSIAGLIGAVVFLRYKKYFYLYGVALIVFSILSHIYIIPSLIRLMENRLTKSIEYSSPFGKGDLFTLDNRPISFEDTMKVKCSLIEYYFVGCPPCEQKLKYLERLKDKVNSNEFSIYLICDGSISDFKDFVANAKKNTMNGISFFYDRNQLKNKIMPGKNYPHEIIIDKDGKIISSQIGFNYETAELYLSENYQTILLVLDK